MPYQNYILPARWHWCELNKFVFCIFFGLLFQYVSVAQSANNTFTTTSRLLSKPLMRIDSLKERLRTAKDNVQRIKMYREICWWYSRYPDVPQLQQYADSVQALAKIVMSEEAVMQAHYCNSIVARLKGDAAQALKHITPYLQYYRSRGDLREEAHGLFQLVNIHIRLGNFEESLAASYRALSINEKLNDRLGVALTLTSIGYVQMKALNYKDAEKHFLKALHELERIDEKVGQSRILIHLGEIYSANGQFEKAESHYRQALYNDSQIGVKRGIAFSLSYLASLFDKTSQFDSALSYHLKAYAIRKQLPDKDDQALSLNSIGLAYLRLKQYSSAKTYLHKALTLAIQIGSKPVVQNVYQNLSKVAVGEGAFKEAYHYQQAYLQIRDSILSAQTIQQLGELQARFETSIKDKQIALLTKDKLLQQKEVRRQQVLKYAFIGGLVLLSLLLFSLLYIFRQRLNNQKLLLSKNNEIKESEFKRQLAELEMKALRAQVNPHFLFNCMNSINRMIQSGELENASFYLTRFSKLVRTILENAGAVNVSLQSELSLLEAYLQMEKLRFKGGMNYTITMDESLNPEQIYVPSMIVQPFVENAVWHGLMHKEENAGMISITIKDRKDRLLCIIEDNGVGRERTKQIQHPSLSKHKSSGIRITEERLKLLSKGIPEDSICITDLKDSMQRPAGTRVEVYIPVYN